MFVNKILFYGRFKNEYDNLDLLIESQVSF